MRPPERQRPARTWGVLRKAGRAEDRQDRRALVPLDSRRNPRLGGGRAEGRNACARERESEKNRREISALLIDQCLEMRERRRSPARMLVRGAAERKRACMACLAAAAAIFAAVLLQSNTIVLATGGRCALGAAGGGVLCRGRRCLRRRARLAAMEVRERSDRKLPAICRWEARKCASGSASAQCGAEG